MDCRLSKNADVTSGIWISSSRTGVWVQRNNDGCGTIDTALSVNIFHTVTGDFNGAAG